MFSAWREVRNFIEYRFSQLYCKGLSKNFTLRRLHVPVSSAAILIAANHNHQMQQQQRLHQQQKQNLSRLLGQQQRNLYCGFVNQCVGNRSRLCAGTNLQKLRTVKLRDMHSVKVNVNFSEFEVRILPALQDNYMYLIVDKKTQEGAIVDPVDADLVVETAKKEKVKLKKVLTTHHHWDHNGGNEKLVSLWPETLDIYGYDERIDGISRKVKHDDCFQIGDLTVRCLYTPCHTTGHICYYVKSPNDEGAVFTGDTLFQAGCGRFFEGTAEQMYAALCLKLSNLPDDTKVFCGHEYTQQNLKFALNIEPTNGEIQKRIKWANLKRATLEPTVPSTIAQEKSWNPFMRVELVHVQERVGESEKVGTMRALRKMKDVFVE